MGYQKSEQTMTEEVTRWGFETNHEADQFYLKQLKAKPHRRSPTFDEVMVEIQENCPQFDSSCIGITGCAMCASCLHGPWSVNTFRRIRAKK